ncbi:MAG: EamA family transporter [Methylotenera sp.]|nr:EamA family transporter [Oligoflexia bacterium]
MLAQGPLYSLFSAALFGVSPALAKLVIGDMSPVLLAGLLYLGSGLGLQLLLFWQRQKTWSALRGLALHQKLKLAGAVVCGGILAPLCLTFGIQTGTAFEVSLLLNLETVATTLIAWLIFHEYIGPRVWTGKVLLLVGAGIITLQPHLGFVFSRSALLILGACLFWGIDNNLTRDVEDLPPTVLASIKGWGAGTFNTALAFALGSKLVSPAQVAGSLSIGALSYGVSLVLFVKALREIGSARASTYFAAGPFFGMVAALFFLGEHPSSFQWLSAVFMAAGLWALYGERHSHVHQHEPLRHSHAHTHDEHHQHTHDGSEGPEPHTHEHHHDPLTHAHAHSPDIHHRHGH